MCQLGCTEVWTTHGAVLTVCMTCLLEILQGKLWVEREVELVSPAELEAGLGEGVVADGCTWMTLCQIGCMSGNLIGYHTCAHIFLVRQGEVLLRCYIAEHGGAEPCYLGATDG